MKVLLIWEEVPERTTFYALEGEDAELSLKCAHVYIQDGRENELINQLWARLGNLPTFHDGGEPIDITNFDKAVICGIIL